MRVSPVVRWSGGLAFVVAAWFVAGATPDIVQRVSDPFTVSAPVGQPAEGRNLGITVTDAAWADRVSFESWSADGNWLVVSASAWVTQDETQAVLDYATASVDGRTFRASERPGFYDARSTLFGTRLNLDAPRTGSVVFELPPDLTDGSVAVRFGLSAETQGDSVIEVVIDLDALDREESVELPRVEWSTP